MSVIPHPTSIDWGQGEWRLPQSVSIRPDNDALAGVAAYLKQALQQRFDAQSKLDSHEGQQAIHLSLQSDAPELHQYRWKEEGYTMVVSDSGARITALTPCGVFYGVQTLLQMVQTDATGHSICYAKVISLMCLGYVTCNLLTYTSPTV